MTDTNSSGEPGGEPSGLPTSAAPKVVVESGSDDDGILTQSDLAGEYREKSAKAAEALENKPADATDDSGDTADETPKAGEPAKEVAEDKGIDLNDVLGDEIVSKLSAKDKEDIQKRYNKMHAITEASKERENVATEALGKVEERLKKLESGETDSGAASDNVPVGMQDKVYAAKTEEDLTAIREKCESAKRFAREVLNSDEEELPFKDGEAEKENGVRWTKSELTNILNISEDALEKWLPSQSNLIKATAEWDEHTLKKFPYLSDKDDENTKWVEEQSFRLKP